MKKYCISTEDIHLSSDLSLIIHEQFFFLFVHSQTKYFDLNATILQFKIFSRYIVFKIISFENVFIYLLQNRYLMLFCGKSLPITYAAGSNTVLLLVPNFIFEVYLLYTLLLGFSNYFKLKI